MAGNLADSAGTWSAEIDLDAAISDLVARDAVDVPPYPAVAMKIERLVAGGDFGLDELARLVSSDQILTADVLRCANSAAYARGDAATSVPQAVARIGAGELSRVAIASSLGARAMAKGPLSTLKRRTWHDAIGSAVLARELARVRDLPPDDAFACGLLHDFGRVLAIECLERIARGARHPRPMPARFWEAVVDNHHLALGTVLAMKWKLPKLIVDAIALHHEKGTGEAESPEMVEVVALCDRLVRLLDDRSHVGPADLDAIQTLSEEDTHALVRGIDIIPGFVAAFEREPPPPSRELLQPEPVPDTAPLRGAVRATVAGAEFAVTGFASHQLVLQGGAALPEGMLLEVELSGHPPTRFHARVILAWEDRGRHGAVLMPFALGGPALLRWYGMSGAAES